MKTELHTFYDLARIQVNALQSSVISRVGGEDAERLVKDLLEQAAIAAELENALREEQQMVRQVAADKNNCGADVIAAVIASTGRVMYAGAGFDPVLGVRPYELMDRQIYELMDEADADELAATLLLMVANPKPIRMLLRLRHCEGSYCTIAASARVISKGLSGSAVLIRGKVAGFEPATGDHKFFRRHLGGGPTPATEEQ